MSMSGAFESSRTATRIGLLAVAAVALLLSAHVHLRAGFTLPNPWNDEPWYLWSTVSVAAHNTLFSESLNPDRIVPLSPVYQIPLGILFKFTGFSFALARWMSWVYIALAYVGILVIVARRPWPVLSAGVATLFLLGINSVVAGNMARPEAMLWAVTVWSFVAMDRGHPWKALAVSGIGALIHPVGLLYFCGILFLFSCDLWRNQPHRRPMRGDWVWLGLALVLVVAQLVFLWQNWAGLVSDSTAAMGHLSDNRLERLFFSNKTPWLITYAVLVGISFWRTREFLVPMVLGACALAVIPIRPQMWYELYTQMGFMWLTLGLPWLLCRGVAGLAQARFRGLSVRAAAGLSLLVFGGSALGMLKFSYNNGLVTGPRNYPQKLEWGWGMHMDPAPYLTEADIQAVLNEIAKYTADGRTYRVFFMPEGDALFFVGRLPQNVVPYQGVWTDVRGDLAVFRLSRHQPPWWREKHVLWRLKLYGGENLAPFYEREGTEKWILVPSLWPENAEPAAE